MHRRNAFTLIEMLVAMALTLFIMVILAQAFVTGLETFRMLKGIGDMEQGLRTATLRLRSDLRADHFEASRKLSDPNFWVDGTPRMGFFRIAQGSTSVPEGSDLDGLPSSRATNHVLHFSIRLRGNEREGFLLASVPNGSPVISAKTTLAASQTTDARFQEQQNTYLSAWGEIAYFLAPQGTTVEPNNPSSSAGPGITPLFSLYRVQKVVVADSNQLNNGPATSTSGPYAGQPPIPASQYAAYAEMSCEQNPNNPNNLYFNSPLDLAGIPHGTWNNVTASWNPTPPRRSITSYTLPMPGASKLLENVISFQVQVMTVPPMPPPNPPYPPPGFYDVPGGSFDTANPTGYTITALQITLRVWDSSTQQTRQVTFIQDM